MSDEPQSVADTLRRARAVIEDRKHWCKGDLAKRQWGEFFGTDPNSDDARMWCALGALSRVDGPYGNDAITTLALTINPSGVGATDDIWHFNDAKRTRHADVLAKFDEAIAKAESTNP